jgi:hypothetical protein
LAPATATSTNAAACVVSKEEAIRFMTGVISIHRYAVPETDFALYARNVRKPSHRIPCYGTECLVVLFCMCT